MNTSETPWWQGKTCGELEGTRVKVTYKNGAIAEGCLDRFGDLDIGDRETVHVSRCFAEDERFDLSVRVESVELLDGPDYERIDGHHDLREGDLVVTLIGNRYKVLATSEGSDYVKCRTLENPGSPFSIDASEICYVLRPKPQLPDKPGLWEDKDGDVWVYADTNAAFLIRCIGSHDENGKFIWHIHGRVHNSSCDASHYAPFHPYKPEADHE